MSWRNQENHKAETKATKDALRKAGIKARVSHGTGTAWGWLNIYPISYPPTLNDWQTRQRAIITIAQRVTGRRGDYDGEILVH